jgi:hypothetical protein
LRAITAGSFAAMGLFRSIHFQMRLGIRPSVVAYQEHSSAIAKLFARHPFDA